MTTSISYILPSIIILKIYIRDVVNLIFFTCEV